MLEDEVEALGGQNALIERDVDHLAKLVVAWSLRIVLERFDGLGDGFAFTQGPKERPCVGNLLLFE